MLNKSSLWIRKNIGMRIAVFVNLVVAFCLSIYSALSVDIRLARWGLFCWLPVARFYTKAGRAVSELEVMQPEERDSSAVLNGSVVEIGTVNGKVNGFKQLVEAMQKEGMVNQSVDGIQLRRWSREMSREMWDSNREQLAEEVKLTLILMNNGIVVKEMPIESIEVLKTKVGECTRYKLARFYVILSVIAFLMAIALVIISTITQQC